MTENETLKYILDRFGCSQDQQAIFGADETDNWFSGAIKVLTKNGILQKTQPAKITECKGCEESCLMEVNILPAKNKQPARAFIACDKRGDVGRINVDLPSLEQWQTSDELLANTLTKLLKLIGAPKRNDVSKEWILGVLRGKKYNDNIVLLIKNGVYFRIAGHNIPLVEILALKHRFSQVS